MIKTLKCARMKTLPWGRRPPDRSRARVAPPAAFALRPQSYSLAQRQPRSAGVWRRATLPASTLAAIPYETEIGRGLRPTVTDGQRLCGEVFSPRRRRYGA